MPARQQREEARGRRKHSGAAVTFDRGALKSFVSEFRQRKQQRRAVAKTRITQRKQESRRRMRAERRAALRVDDDVDESGGRTDIDDDGAADVRTVTYSDSAVRVTVYQTAAK